MTQEGCCKRRTAIKRLSRVETESWCACIPVIAPKGLCADCAQMMQRTECAACVARLCTLQADGDCPWMQG